MRFDSVLLLDKYLANLLGQASREGLIVPGCDQDLDKHFRRFSSLREDCLVLVTLFDRLVVPDNGGNFRIPILENSGLLQTVVPDSAKRGVSAAATRSDSYARRAESLQDCAALRPLVFNWILKHKAQPFELDLMRDVGISRRALYGGMLDHALALYRRDKRGLQASPIRKWATSKAVSLVNEELRNPPSIDGPSFPPFEYMVQTLMLSATFVRDYQKISHDHEAIIASHELTGLSGDIGVTQERIAPQEATRRFRLVRCAAEEEGLCLPRIAGIRDALSLRRDPNWSAFRKQLLLFVEHFAKGDRDAVVELRQEIRKANRGLARAGRVHRALTWTTYASLPIGVAESFLLGAPIAGTALTVFSVGGTAAADILQRRYDWVLFGSHIKESR